MSSMSLAERVAVLSHTDVVVMQSGANQLNLLFCDKRPRRVVVIEHKLQAEGERILQGVWPHFAFERISTDPVSGVVNQSQLCNVLGLPCGATSQLAVASTRSVGL